MSKAERWRSFQASLVYLNLHLTAQEKKVVYSVLGRDGKVAFHAHHLLVKNAKFVVKEAIRLQVVENQKKAVHAGVRGEVEVDPEVIKDVLQGSCHPVSAYYNPYEVDCFVVGVRAILSVPWVYLTSDTNKPKLSLYGASGGFKWDDGHDPFAWKN